MSELERDSTLFVGGIPRALGLNEMEDLFSRYGPLNKCQIKGNYGFVSYRDIRDAEEAYDKIHRKVVYGSPLNVEWSRGKRSRRDNECFQCGRSGHWARDCPRRNRSRSRDMSRDRYRSYRSHSRDRYRSPSRDRYRGRSPSLSPRRDRSLSPRRDSLSPRRDRSLSPRRDRSLSPRRDSLSPRRDRSLSPRRDRSLSPRRDRSLSPRRDRSLSPPRTTGESLSPQHISKSKETPNRSPVNNGDNKDEEKNSERED